jgi:excisionase family DNA binding protein
MTSELLDEIALTVSEASVVMRVSKNTVYRMVERGELGGVKLGRKLFIPTKEVLRIFEPAQATKPQGAVRPPAVPSTKTASPAMVRRCQARSERTTAPLRGSPRLGPRPGGHVRAARGCRCRS